MASKKASTDTPEETTTKVITLATRWGHEFIPNGKDLPTITPAGVAMSEESAETIMEQARKHGVTIISKED